jgi:serine/threonine-protein phosphatase 5
MSQEAIELKNKGNKAFAAGDWPTAIDFYTKAIELNDKEPLFLTNRAQVRSPPALVTSRVTNLRS